MVVCVECGAELNCTTLRDCLDYSEVDPEGRITFPLKTS
jgi:hypothetical protein